MSNRNMAAAGLHVHTPSEERIRNVTLPAEFREIASLCTATEIEIGGRVVLGIGDLRDLHAGLGVGRDYSNWIKDRIADYGFVEGRDYEVSNAKDNCSPNLTSKDVARRGVRGGHNAKFYRGTLRLAKQLAMVDGGEKGQLVRDYFLWCEEITTRPAAPVLDLMNPDHLLPLLAQYATDKKHLLAKVAEMQPAVAALDRLANPTDGASCLTDTAKDLQIKPSDLIRWLEQHRWIYRRPGSRRRMVAYQDRIQSGHLEHKLREVDDGEGGTRIAEQVMVTPRARALLAKLLSDEGRSE